MWSTSLTPQPQPFSLSMSWTSLSSKHPPLALQPISQPNTDVLSRAAFFPSIIVASFFSHWEDKSSSFFPLWNRNSEQIRATALLCHGTHRRRCLTQLWLDIALASLGVCFSTPSPPASLLKPRFPCPPTEPWLERESCQGCPRGQLLRLLHCRKVVDCLDRTRVVAVAACLQPCLKDVQAKRSSSWSQLLTNNLDRFDM